jgi:hypothetical protein
MTTPPSKKLNHPLWRQLGARRFENLPLSPDILAKPLPTNDCTLRQFGLVRNARITFSIEVLEQPHQFHAAVLFRKNGEKYLGAGLGGWSSNYSIFVKNRGFVFGHPMGREIAIQKGRTYQFILEFKAGFITKFTMDDENLIFDDFSIKKLLGSTLSNGNIGLYAYGDTKVSFSLSVKKLPTRCFVVTNIDRKTDKRRRSLSRLLEPLGLEVLFSDARELSRDHPLMKKIQDGMVRSDLVICDFGFGKPRPNVFYETGLAHSLGIPTVHLGPVMKAFNRIVPSDLRAQFFVLEHELKTKLPETVKSILESHSGDFNYLG